MKLLQINVTANSGSHGRITEGIGLSAQNAGFESWIAYGRYANQSSSNLIKIGSKFDTYIHGIESRLFDNHGLSSRNATASFLKKIETINPDIIHLHNIHGYYINYKMLFGFFSKRNIPIVWTLHDCWPFTGHCVYFSFSGCNKWKKECQNCPQKKTYPASWIFDRSKKNYIKKKECFSSISNLTIVSVSHWLDRIVSDSFLGEKKHVVIHNGIDTDTFIPYSNTEDIRKRHNIQNDDIILLGVANKWSKRKGLRDFIELSRFLSPQEKIILIGLTRNQIKKLPQSIIGIERTESTNELAKYYSTADLFLNLTYEDNYPSTNLEAISCGTPCLTYRTGGSIESITEDNGFIVDCGNINDILNVINSIKTKKKDYTTLCRESALRSFQEKKCFKTYIDLYNNLL